MRISDWSSDVCSSDLLNHETGRWWTRHEHQRQGLYRGDLRASHAQRRRQVAGATPRRSGGGRGEGRRTDRRLCRRLLQSGRESDREREGQYGEIRVEAYAFKKKNLTPEVYSHN